ncbi:MAG: MerR family transcriptional regulator [Fusobacteriaceae bacterium]
MSDKSSLYFTTGEFAKLFNVTKHTLFHYDEVNVFSPALRKENEYRMYGVDQIEVFKVILTLKDLGMPLKEIKEYMDERNPERFINLMKEREKIIDEKINYLKGVKKLFKAKAEIVRESMQIDTSVIEIKEYPEEYLIPIKTEIKNEKDISLYLAEHMRFCEKKKIYSPHAISGTQKIENILKGIYMKYSCFYTKVAREQVFILRKNDIPFTLKEKGYYVVAYHSTGYDSLGETYDRIFNYIFKNNLEIIGEFYEDVLLDELSIKGYDNYMVQISVKIK